MINVFSAVILTRKLITPELGRSLLQCFVDSEGSFFYPSHAGDVESGTPVFAEKKIDEFAELLMGSFLYIAGRKSHKWEGLLEFLPADSRRKRKDPFARISVRVLEKNIKTAPMVGSFVRLAQDLADTAQADYARIDYKRADVAEDLNIMKGLPDVYWWNYLGSPYVELFGKEKLLSAPCFHVYETENAVVLQATESYKETMGPSFEELKNEIKKHISARAFRSAKKKVRRPKTPDFDCP